MTDSPSSPGRARHRLGHHKNCFLEEGRQRRHESTAMRRLAEGQLPSWKACCLRLRPCRIPRASRSRLVAQVTAELAGSTRWSNNAGRRADFGPIEDTTFARWRTVKWKRNLDGVFLLTQPVSPPCGRPRVP